MSDRLPSICFVAPNAFPVLAGDEKTALIGGAELQQVIVAKGLAERGYQVSMICLNFGQEAQVEIHGIRVYRAFRPDEGLPVVRFVWPRLSSIWSCLKHADADIYYQRTAGLLTGVVAAFCRRYSRKSVFAVAGNPDLEPNTPRIRYARDRRIYEYGVRGVDRILVQNEEQQRLCRLNYRRESTLVPNCYPLPSVGPENPGSHVLWVSTIRQIKRPELFLELAEALPHYQFVMIGGPGNDEAPLFNSVKERAELIPNLEFLGFVPYAKIGRFFDDTSVFVNTSESEGFPNTFLQAWARGVPTVSFVDCGARAGGRPVGRHVDSNNQMVKCVTKFLLNESNRRREGIRCRNYVEGNHSPELVLDVYARIIGELVKKRA